MPGRAVLAAALTFAALAASCGGGSHPEPWPPGPPNRSTIPVLVFDGVGSEQLGRQLGLLAGAGYETIGLGQLVRFRQTAPSDLPPHPLLLTFDGLRGSALADTDAALRRHGFTAVLFAETGPLDAEGTPYRGWRQLDELERSGRWDVQLQAGTGRQLIRYGPGRDDVGPFYAYRGTEERIDGWRERVFSDISDGERQLAFRVPGHRPLAFAPPYGNYGQAGTNDPRIPRLLLRRLLLDYRVVFTQDRSGFARPGTSQPVGRLVVTKDVDDGELRALLIAAA